MKPVALKVMKELRKAKRQPVINLAAAREAKELQKSLLAPRPELDSLPPNHAAWLRALPVLSGIASLLLETHALRKLADRVRDADEEYMPGGPPMSPVLDSVFMTWWMADLGSGPVRESLCSVIAECGPALGLPAELIRCARVLDESRWGVYRVKDLGADRVELEELMGETRVVAHVPDDLRSRGPLWLTRVLPPLHAEGSDWVVWTTPYLLGGPSAESEWRAYCERAVAGASLEQRVDRLAQHFKARGTPERFMELIMDGYAGESEIGEIVLLGVPDRPETLPHNAAYQGSAELEVEGTPLHRVRIRLMQLAGGLPRDFSEPTAPSPHRSEALAEMDRLMRLAFRMYGATDGDGTTALDRLLRDAAGLPDDERTELRALSAGWFGVFEIRHIRVDEGFDVRDVLNARPLWISERSATRQAQIGDALAGWLMIDGDRAMLEGALCHVPAMYVEAFLNELKRVRRSLASEHKALRADRRDALLAPLLVPMLERAMAATPPPRFVNRDGDDLLLSQARYKVRLAARVTPVLELRFERGADGIYHCVEGGGEIARIEMRGGELIVQCNSKRRLKQVKARLREYLGSTIEHVSDTYDDPAADLRAGRSHSRPPPSPSPPAMDLPPEALAGVQAMLLARMRSWIDEPIPMLKGKTPRQAVRSAKGGDDVTHLLVSQQQLFSSQPSLTNRPE